MIRRLSVAVLLLAAPTAFADDPKFDFQKQEEVKEVVWKVSANLGLIYTTGNSETLTISAGASASRNDGANKIALDIAGAFARSEVLTIADTNMNGMIDQNEISRVPTVTAETWNIKLRYDRFLTENNALYITGIVGGDIIAGKELVASGQAGYSRHLYQSKVQDLAAELGYDFSFVDYADDMAMPKTIQIHSARVFVGYNNALTPDTALALSLESLFNLNPLDLPAMRHAGPFEDVRLLGKASITTKLWKNFSLRIAFTAKYDNFPAPLKGPAGIPFAPGVNNIAEKFDTITEAALVVNFI
jgi:hypothetical protein